MLIVSFPEFPHPDDLAKKDEEKKDSSDSSEDEQSGANG